ncbi:hypothetical protein FFE93_019785 [Yersinia sp. KBS0713]|nr:hypothetical protein FFE93_019785 [Yersinia sp. KBS0713]
MTNSASSQVREGATVPRGASVAYATTTPTEHLPLNRLCQQSVGAYCALFYGGYLPSSATGLAATPC